MQTTSHVQRLPLRTQPYLSTATSAQRPPIPTRFLLFRVEKILQADTNIADDRVLEDIAVVNDLQSNNGRGLVGAQKFR